MKKNINVLLVLLIGIANLSVCYADWQDTLRWALQNKVTTLDLSHQDITDMGVATHIVEALTSPDCKLIELKLNNNNISYEGAKCIADALTSPDCKLTKLNLNLDENNITPDGDQLIANALAIINARENSLQNQVVNGKLKLTNRTLSEMDILEICALQSIETLMLINCQLKDIPLFPQNYPAKNIALSENNFNFQSPKNFERLKRLFLLPCLKALGMDKCSITHIDIDPKLCHIQQLSLKTNKLDANTVTMLARIASLEVLVLQECGLKCNEIRAFISALYEQQSTNLRVLNLSCNDNLQKNADLGRLFQLESLRILSLGDCNIKSLAEFNPEKSRLENLNLAKNPLDDQSFMAITRIPSLKQLEIHGCSLKQQILQEVLEIPQIEVVNLNGCNIDHISLDSCKIKNSKIRQLWVAGNNLDEASFSIIAQLPLLTKLNICRFTEKQQKNLHELAGIKYDPNARDPRLFDLGSQTLQQAVQQNLGEVWLLANQYYLDNQRKLAHIFSMKNLNDLEIREAELYANWPLKKGGMNIKKIDFGVNSQPYEHYLLEYLWLPNSELIGGTIFQKSDIYRVSDLYVMLSKPDKDNPNIEFISNLFKSHLDTEYLAVYVIVGDVIYTMRNMALTWIGSGVWVQDIAKGIEPSNTPVRLSQEVKAIIVSNTDPSAITAIQQQQRVGLYHDFNRLKTERNAQQDENDKRQKPIEKAAIDLNEMIKNTLNIFEGGGQ